MSNTIEVKCSRSGNTYAVKELSSLESSDAAEFSPAAPVFGRMAMAIQSINGVLAPPVTSRATLRQRLQTIVEGDLNLIYYHYQKAFEPTEQDLGNESAEGVSPAS